MELETYMKVAISEAKQSLCEGNKGFGAVIVHNHRIIASAYDTEETEADATSHAEINVIKKASKILGRKLSDCILVSTHEPCPMCAFAIVWAGIETVAYGYSIKDALTQKRRRIDFSCQDAFIKANANIQVYAGVLKEECAILYREDVRQEIQNLRNIDDQGLDALCQDSIRRRVGWVQENKDNIKEEDIVMAGYQLLLNRLHITSSEAPIIKKTDTEVIFHSQNFCPTLEACKILGLDTRHICKKMNEVSMDALVKQLDSRLHFSRNYQKLRPHSPYCEERISIID